MSPIYCQLIFPGQYSFGWELYKEGLVTDSVDHFNKTTIIFHRFFEFSGIKWEAG